jgi:peptide chain release factor 2
MREMEGIREEIKNWEGLRRRVEDAEELLFLEEEDDLLRKEIQSEIEDISRKLDKVSFELLFSGEHDIRDAIVSIHSGAGGLEACDFAHMLFRMYLRFCERRGYEVETLSLLPGEEVGIRGVTFKIKGRYAYGYLKGEEGVHRLVRISPFDADHARHTSFASVEVIPQVEDIEVVIEDNDLRVETFKSSGPGGQHMQKTCSAVRMTHLPTGISAVCQSERSQHQNKESALSILKSRILNLELRRKEEEVARHRGQKMPIAFGSQIRSYVLHPYKMVKDHRTGKEIGNAMGVLDGKLDDLIQAYLTSRL